MTSKVKGYLFISLAVLCIAAVSWLLLTGKDSKENKADPKSRPSTAFKEGKKLSEKYCTACHTYPEPGLLDKKTWVIETLPNMGPRFGIFSHNDKKYPTEKTPNLPEHIYPEKQVLSHEQWQKILDYYQQAAPEKLVPPERKKIITDGLFFKARSPGYRASTPPMVTAIKLDPGNRAIYLSDASNKQFLIFNSKLEYRGQFSVLSPMSDIHFTNDITQPGRRDLLASFIGDLPPSDELTGFVQKVWYNPQTGHGAAGEIISDSLARPVQTRFTDLNRDGRNDYLINEFGHRRGSLFWLENLGRGSFSGKKILMKTPGCIESHVADLTGDRLPDIITLCSQVDQAIYLFENEGKGNFSQRKLLQFNIAAGSTSFKLHDLNNDGHLDILYTSGDNADYSIIYKPYHGVYIYLNDGKNNFLKKWFYPINGAYDAVARDFDQDGNLDIAAIAFFADYDNNPEEGFIYFQNEGHLTFTPYHHPAASNGRWIAMDVRDWTGNGKADIVLANFSLGPTRVKSLIEKKFTGGPHFLLLENR